VFSIQLGNTKVFLINAKLATEVIIIHGNLLQRIISSTFWLSSDIIRAVPKESSLAHSGSAATSFVQSLNPPCENKINYFFHARGA
jgi:hypothetical protein